MKTDSNPEVCEFGLEAFQNAAAAGANTFGFGDNRLYYLGPEAAYTTATEADYNAEVEKAKGLIAKYGIEDPTTAWIIYKLMRYVGHADYPWAEGLGYKAPTTLMEKQNVILSLEEYIQMLEYTVNPALGINDATTSDAKVVLSSDGVYTLSGVKVGNAADLKNMKSGLYIVKGKKYLVK